MVEPVRNTSIVMVSYHTGPALWPAIRAALAQEECAELILVNNGNPSGVIEKLRHMAEVEPRLLVVSGQGNVGYGRGCNLGVARASGNYILLLNPDCLLPRHALFALSAILAGKPKAMAAGALIINPDGSEQRAARRNLLTPVTALSEALQLHRVYKKAPRLNAQNIPLPDAPVCVPAFSGALILMRIDDFRTLGGFDEGYFLHVEDLDLFARIASAGGESWLHPGVRAVHIKGTSDTGSVFVEWCKLKGFIRYFRIHYPAQKKLSAAVCAGAALRFVLKAAHITLQYLLPHKPDTRALQGRRIVWFEENRTFQSDPITVPDQANILLTGATSPVGLAILAKLLAAEASVTAISREMPLLTEQKGVRWLQSSVELLAEKSLAPHTHALHVAPLWLLEKAIPAFVKCGVKHVVAFGSTSRWGKADSGDSREQRTVERLTRSEEIASQLAAQHGLTLTILYPTLIYGAGLDKNVTRLASLIRRFGFLPIVPPASGLRQPVHASDLADAALTALQTPEARNRHYILAGGETLSYRAMAERIFEALDKPPRFLPLLFLPSLLDSAGSLFPRLHVNGAMARRMNRDLVFDDTPARADLHYAPRRFLIDGRDALL